MFMGYFDADNISKITHINNFPADLTDASAKTKSLEFASLIEQCFCSKNQVIYFLGTASGFIFRDNENKSISGFHLTNISAETKSAMKSSLVLVLKVCKYWT